MCSLWRRWADTERAFWSSRGVLTLRICENGSLPVQTMRRASHLPHFYSILFIEGTSMSVMIQEEDFVSSIADAIQFISYYHPADYIKHLARAYEREESPAAKDAMAQILTNSRMSAEGRRPICQDTGIVNVFLQIGMDVRFNTKKMLSWCRVIKLRCKSLRRAVVLKTNRSWRC